MNKFAPTKLIIAVLLLALSVVTPVYAATIEESQKPFLDLIRAPQAHQVTKGAGVTVAVLDTGVDAGHPDLAGALLPSYHVDQESVEAANSDPDGHGTAMSGIIAARGGGFNNALGVAPQANILPVAMDFNSTDVGATLSKAIRWAVDHDAKILNMSLARPSYEPLSRAEVEAVAYAQSKGAVLIVSGGNTKDLTGGNNIAALPGVVAVAATTLEGDPYSGSEVREYNAIAAPGKGIVTTGARNIHSTGFVSDSGTSPATAVVAGVAALIKAQYPDIDAANIVNRLIKTAQDKGEPGRDQVYGFGIVDAYAAVTADVPSVSENPLGVTEAPTSDQQSTATTGPSGTEVMALIIALILPLIFWTVVIVIIVLIVKKVRKNRLATPPTTDTAKTPPFNPYPSAPPTPQPNPFEPAPPAYPPTMPTAPNPPQPPQAPTIPAFPPAPQVGQNPVVGPVPQSPPNELPVTPPNNQPQPPA